MGRFLSDSAAWGIVQSHTSSSQHQSLQNPLLLQSYWYCRCSVHVSHYWAYPNSRKAWFFIFILPTMENDFSHNFGPFILFIISWLSMNHPLYLCHLKEFTAGAYFLQFFFHDLYESKYFSSSPNVSFLCWPIFISPSFSIFPDFNANPEDLCHILIRDIRNRFFCY